jgi:predicted dehydrogenase
MKICFIGACGHSSQAYKYLKTRQDAEFAGFAPGSSHETKMPKFAENMPYFADYQRMLAEVKPDLAVVSPVFGLTASVILECAKRKIDVFSEKPVATTLEDLEKVEKAVAESGIRFCAMHYLRYDPAFYTGAKLVKDGAVGDVQLITAQKSYKYGTRPEWYQDPDLYGGTIPWVGIHAIDWIYHFTGKRFLSVATQKAGEMAAVCQFSLEGGAIGAMNLDFYRPAGAATHGDDRVRCVGTEGVLEVQGGKITLITPTETREIQPEPAPELLEEFLAGGAIPPEELFYLTRVALIARDGGKL